jgi:hypothetical protein
MGKIDRWIMVRSMENEDNEKENEMHALRAVSQFQRSSVTKVSFESPGSHR